MSSVAHPPTSPQKFSKAKVIKDSSRMCGVLVLCFMRCFMVPSHSKPQIWANSNSRLSMFSAVGGSLVTFPTVQWAFWKEFWKLTQISDSHLSRFCSIHGCSSLSCKLVRLKCSQTTKKRKSLVISNTTIKRRRIIIMLVMTHSLSKSCNRHRILLSRTTQPRVWYWRHLTLLRVTFLTLFIKPIVFRNCSWIKMF